MIQIFLDVGKSKIILNVDKHFLLLEKQWSNVLDLCISNILCEYYVY